MNLRAQFKLPKNNNISTSTLTVNFYIKSTELAQIMNHFLGGEIIVSGRKKWVWVGGSKREGQKSRNESAKIFPQRAENQKAENTIRPKRISLTSIALLPSQV